MEDIKEIRVLPMSKEYFSNENDAKYFLSDELFTENEGHYQFASTKINFIGKTLILFQYDGALIASGIITDIFEEDLGEFKGYYVVDKESIRIFKKKILPRDLKKYGIFIKLSRSKTKIDLKHLSDVLEMIKFYSVEVEIFHVWAMNVSKEENQEHLFKHNDCVSVDFGVSNNNVNYSSFQSKDNLEEFFKADFPDKLKEMEFINIFVNSIKIGDIIIVCKGNNLISGVGIVTSDYIYKCDDLRHLRKIKWLYNENDIEITDNKILAKNAIVKLDEYPNIFNEIICKITGIDKKIRNNFLNFIFNQFYEDFYSTSEGEKHIEDYGNEKDIIRSVWQGINKEDSHHEIAGKIWVDIFQRDKDIQNFKVNSLNLKNTIKKGLLKKGVNASDEYMDELGFIVFDTIEKILNNPYREQKKILNEFCKNKYDYNIQAGRLTPILFYLDDSFYPINNATVNGVEILSQVFGNDLHLSVNMNEYLENNSNYHQFLINLNNDFSFEKFENIDIYIFDQFCYWLDSDYNYLGKKAEMFPKEIFGSDIINDIKKDSVNRNLIYFGAPGTGKSHKLNECKNKLLGCEFKDNYERVTFHPDYSYANFVGTYKPSPKHVEDDDGNDVEKITYKYVPGPFMRSLVEALKKPEEPFLLIIEEINRANAAAVFGDIFQLLDRENNISKFPIQSSKEMRKYLEDELSDEVHKSYIFDLLGEEYEKIRIPKNMYIWATMNNADQGVFPIDTAFKRRWDFEYFPINPEDDDRIENIKIEVPPKWKLKNNILKWNDLRQKINDELLEYGINEDKLIGPYFAFDKYLDGDELIYDNFVDIFQNKILMYLYEDAARSRRDRLFDKKVVKILYSDIREKFKENGIRIFCENIKKDFLDDNNE